MKKQEIFDTVTKHLLTQNRKSKRDFKHCAYYGKNGLKCAIGCLIPQDVYDPKMDTGNLGINYIRDFFPKLKKIIPKTTLNLCIDLQMLHDSNHPNQWKKGLKLIADKFGLKYKILKKNFKRQEL